LKLYTIKFKILQTSHILIKAKINDVLGNFILDTGASNTCIGYEYEEKFNFILSDQSTFTASASDENLSNHISLNNKIQLGRWHSYMDIVAIDISTINIVMKKLGITEIHGIIGADVLLEGTGIIDYSQNKLLLHKF
jgi:hypothetical protein